MIEASMRVTVTFMKRSSSWSKVYFKRKFSIIFNIIRKTEFLTTRLRSRHFHEQWMESLPASQVLDPNTEQALCGRTASISIIANSIHT